MPSYAVGYVYVPALVGIVITSTILAPVGARVAHALPVAKLRFVFSTMLFCLGAYMLRRTPVTRCRAADAAATLLNRGKS